MGAQGGEIWENPLKNNLEKNSQFFPNFSQFFPIFPHFFPFFSQFFVIFGSVFPSPRCSLWVLKGGKFGKISLKITWKRIPNFSQLFPSFSQFFPIFANFFPIFSQFFVIFGFVFPSPRCSLWVLKGVKFGKIPSKITWKEFPTFPQFFPIFPQIFPIFPHFFPIFLSFFVSVFPSPRCSLWVLEGGKFGKISLKITRKEFPTFPQFFPNFPIFSQFFPIFPIFSPFFCHFWLRFSFPSLLPMGAQGGEFGKISLKITWKRIPNFSPIFPFFPNFSQFFPIFPNFPQFFSPFFCHFWLRFSFPSLLPMGAQGGEIWENLLKNNQERIPNFSPIFPQFFPIFPNFSQFFPIFFPIFLGVFGSVFPSPRCSLWVLKGGKFGKISLKITWKRIPNFSPIFPQFFPNFPNFSQFFFPIFCHFWLRFSFPSLLPMGAQGGEIWENLLKNNQEKNSQLFPNFPQFFPFFQFFPNFSPFFSQFFVIFGSVFPSPRCSLWVLKGGKFGKISLKITWKRIPNFSPIFPNFSPIFPNFSRFFPIFFPFFCHFLAPFFLPLVAPYGCSRGGNLGKSP
ncbi:DNA-directed RNA polymerase II subunit RPB1-like [Poecile atricapillus]|uniref:DNA-directed RNA polymerase II subunit RPB1-like n=1 Tax=Poecile atricapillus TaxID=48891 RepID=UPI00273918A8|nr:DNA-directed RNA polymerase II subunit RPB1-like [Poecile atricapillus]